MTRWLEIAWQQVGVQETSGADATPDIIGYFRTVGRADVTSDEVAWCAAAAGACLERAGIPQLIAPAEALLARSYLNVGVDLQGELRMGCIVVLSRGSDPRQGHVGFCVGWSDEHVVLLGGNQSNKFCTQHFARSRIIGTRWPEVAAVTRKAAVDQSRIVKAADRQARDVAKGGGAQMMPAPPVPAPPVAPIAEGLPSLPAPDVLAGKATALQASLETLISFLQFAAGKWPWLMLLAGCYYGLRVLYDSALIRKWRLEDAITGKTVLPTEGRADA